MGSVGYERLRQDMLAILEPPRHPVSDLEDRLRWLKCNKPPARLGEPARLAWLDLVIAAVDGADEAEWLKAIENIRRGNHNTFFPFLSDLELVKRRLWFVMDGQADPGGDIDSNRCFRPNWGRKYAEWAKCAAKRSLRARVSIATVV